MRRLEARPAALAALALTASLLGGAIGTSSDAARTASPVTAASGTAASGTAASGTASVTAATATAASVSAAPVPAAAVALAAPAAADGWTTVFSDDFDGAAGSPVGPAWIHELGTWGTGAVDRTTDSTANVFLDGGGNLGIRALRDQAGAWTSGRIITREKSFAAPAGGQLLMTASIRQPSPAQATGYWPAFWALGLDENGAIDWPRTGEIDILEAVNGTSQVIQTFHCDLVDAGECDEPYGLTSGLQDCVGCLSTFHTYSALVDRRVAGQERLQFLVDGEVRHTVEQAGMSAEAWSAAIGNDYFLILNLAIGGGLPNGVCGCDSASAPKTSGGTMSVDHVAVYRSEAPAALGAPTPTILGSPTVGSTLTAQPGAWTPAPVALAYQWSADGVAVSGATAAAYTPTSGTVGKRISVTVTGAKAGFPAESRTAPPTAVVAKGTLTAPTPTITGTAKVGSTLTAKTGTWGPAPVALKYQWRAGGTAIAGATAATYVPTTSVVGARITVSVTGTKTGWTTAVRTSGATAAVVR
ncbi:family 16 glycosylhydrolase [Rathayibacter sp. VKM Ac-2856]|uniref:family 16 glycosylhydrolase n=1 Tax=unclassified Rathayibacter TaxID=2609250 RepID=UPI001565B734|nr:family 16 glycosylhydrolase [Rathayibacter sp. VKM Ac-2858]NQX20787.1 family 16 glycosylhydrolase [Rathayibacter sp. VKM Ac-2856]